MLGRQLGFVLLFHLWHARPLTPLTSEARVMQWGVCQAIWGSASLRDLPQQRSCEAGNFPSWHSQAGEGWGHSNRELCSCTRHQLCTSLQCGEERGWGMLFGLLAVRWGEVRNGAEGWFWGRSGRPSGRSSCGSGRSLWEQHGSAGRPGWCRWRARVWRGGFYFEMQTWNKKHKTRALCRPCTTPSVLRASKMTRNTTTATVKYAGKKNNFWPWNCVLNKLPQSESGGFSWQHLEGKQKEEGGCTRLHLGLAPGLRRRRAWAPPGDFIHI